MMSRDFCYWLQGFFELAGTGDALADGLTPKQTATVRAHLALVFKHEIDPSAGGPDMQKILTDIHEAAKHQDHPPSKVDGHGPDGTIYRC